MAIILKLRKRFFKLYRVLKTKKLNSLGKLIYFAFFLFGKRGIALILITTILGSNILLNIYSAFAASYTWNQTNWSGGLDGGTYPNHTNNKTGWTKYSATTTGIIAGSSSVTLDRTSSSTIQTTDTDFGAGTFSSTTASGSGVSSIISLVNHSTQTINTWQSVSVTPSTIHGGGSLVYPGSGDYIYAMRGLNSTGFYRYSIANNSWETISNSVPGSVSYGGSLVYPGSGDYIYAFRGNNTNDFYRYSTASSSWQTRASTTAQVFNGGSLVYPGSDEYIYGFRGDTTKDFWKYSTTSNSWQNLASTSVNISHGGSLVYPGSGNIIYGFRGDLTEGFVQYSTASNSWITTSSGNASNPGASVVAVPNGVIYALKGNVTKDFYRYSTTTNIFTPLASTTATAAVSYGGSLVYPGSGNFIYALIGNSTNNFLRYSFSEKYNNGNFTSSNIDLGQFSYPTSLNYTAATSSATLVKFQIRSATSTGLLSSATWLGPDGTSATYYTSSGQSINSVHDGHRYFQYKAFFETTDIGQTPTLSDVTINYDYYPSSATLTSSAYNTLSPANIVHSIAWNETLPANTDIKFQIRTAPDNGSDAPGTWSDFTGPTGTTTYFTDPTGLEAIPGNFTDLSNDQWIQYKVFLSSNGYLSPTLSEVTFVYVVNAAPEFSGSGVSVVQNSTGAVIINYSILDSDTTTATTSFKYSLNNGSTWNDIPSSNMASGDTDEKTIASTTYTDFSATWFASTTISGATTTQAKIKVIVNDREVANNIASSTSAAFIIDTKVPDIRTPIKVNASQSPASVTLDVIDDSSLEMKISKMLDLSGIASTSYTTQTTVSLSDGDNVYAEFRDAYGNISTSSVRLPITPSNLFFQDTSDDANGIYREFLAWGIAPTQSIPFKQYNIFRSEDGVNYLQIATTTNSLINYIIDTDLSSTTNYWYKVSVQDVNDNISFFSAPTTSDMPNGFGGSDLAGPVLNNIGVNSITATGATITWTTDKYSDSTIYYIATTTYPGNIHTDYVHSLGVPSMASTNHSVILSGLTPGTKYFFLPKSQDSYQNSGTFPDYSNTFTTSNDPIITNVTASQIFDNEATISWNTDVPASSQVYFSENADLSNSALVNGTVATTTNHHVVIDNLTEGVQYWYYVKSVDESSNEVSKYDDSDGTLRYFKFNTTHDSEPPIISNITAALVGETGATITWTTNEPTSSLIGWGTSSILGASTTETSTYSTQHAVVLNNLATSTKYFYVVVSKDKSLNMTIDNNSGNIYDFTTLTPSTTHSTSTEYATTTVYVGGGGGTIDNRDLTKPIVTNVKVEAIGGDSAVISFKTSKVSSGQIKYGETISYDGRAGKTDIYGNSHIVTLTKLKSKKLYHFKAFAVDIYGNSGEFSDLSFTTLEGGIIIDTSQIPNNLDEPTSPEDISLLQKIKDASSLMLKNIFASISSNKNLANLSETEIASSLSYLANKALSSPAISGTEINVEVSSRSAKIRWTTDKNSNSLVSYADAIEYNKDSNKPYTITSGSPDEKVLEHEVVLENLSPSTTYHYQVRSQSALSQVSLSADKTFTTTSLLPEIADAIFDNIGENTASLKWKTDLPTKSIIEIRNSETGEIKREEDLSYVKDHVYIAKDLNFSTGYSVKITAMDSDGNTSSPSVIPFVTVLSTEAPIISNVRITVSIIPDKKETTQTIISWKTDKPSTSRIFYAEGASTELNQSTPIENNLVRDHIVITTALHQNTVYKISVESGDSGKNITRSTPYTTLTPKSKDSVVDIIFKNFDSTFGFLKGK
jgi:hypothetical protein